MIRRSGGSIRRRVDYLKKALVGSRGDHDCLILCLNAFIYLFMTLFRMFTCYIEVLKFSSNINVSPVRFEVFDLRNLLVEIIGWLVMKKKRLQQLRKSFKVALKESILPLDSILREFYKFIDVDLVSLIRLLDQKLLLDMFRNDFCIMRNGVRQSVDSIIKHLNECAFKDSSFENFKMHMQCFLLYRNCLEVKQILDLNLPLIKGYVMNQIPLSSFLITRNETSLKFLIMDANLESNLSYLNESTIKGQTITFSKFKETVVSDISSTLRLSIEHITLMISIVKESLDLFFELSNYLEGPLAHVLDTALLISQDPVSKLDLISNVFDQFQKLIQRALNYKEFQESNLELMTLLKLLAALHISIQNVTKVIVDFQSPDTPSPEMNYQERFKVLIDSLSCCSLGINVAITDYKDKYKNIGFH